MSTSNGQAPRHAAHFGGSGQAPRTPQARQRTSGTTRPASRMRPQAAPDRRAGSTGAVGTRSALGSTGVSSRTVQATRRAGSGNVRKRGKRGRASALPAIVAGVIAAAAVIGLVVLLVIPRLTGAGSSDADKQQITAGQVVEVTVPDGSGASAIAQALYDAGVIESKSDFLNQVRRTNSELSLKSGTYSLVTGDSLDNIIKLLSTGPNSTAATLTIPEGFTVAKVASAVESQFGISAEDFTAQAKASNYVADYPFLAAANNDSLEGYLFPKTYDFSGKDVTSDLVIRTMLSQWQTEMAGVDFDAAIASLKSRFQMDFTQEDILAVASIVERETNSDDDRATVASVFYNRLAVGMPLQSDATTAYYKGGDFSAADLKDDNEWNTYTRTGLTPTPICSPGLASIQAACNPDDTSYYYFFISGDYHAFSETYEQHQKAIDARPQ